MCTVSNWKLSIEMEMMKHLRHKKYAAVFNSTTLGAIQRIDLIGAELNLGTKQANRSLNYEAACRVGIRFLEAWWILSPLKVDEGGQGKTDFLIRVCVLPSYNIHDDPRKPFVLLALLPGSRMPLALVH